MSDVLIRSSGGGPGRHKRTIRQRLRRALDRIEAPMARPQYPARPAVKAWISDSTTRRTKPPASGEVYID